MWVLPSYGRPGRLAKLADVGAANDVEMYIRLHADDPELLKYLDKDWPEKWYLSVGPTMRLAPTLNDVFKDHPDEPFYGLMADDVIPSPSGWAQALEQAAGAAYLSFPDDGHHHEYLCPHHCIGGDLMRAVGWWSLPGLSHSFLDTVWYGIAQQTGRLRYMPDILLDHYHAMFGRAPGDETYKRGSSEYQNDMMTFKIWAMGGGVEETVRKVKDAELETSS